MHLSIQNISKIYSNKVKALNDISLDVNAGMFGLLGPNGAGKSSLMRTLATLQHPTQGNILFNGQDIFKNRHSYRRTLGYLPQEFGVYQKESAQSLLNYFAILKGIYSKKDRNLIIGQVLETTNLVDARKQSVSTYSGGMKQRFGIAQLLLNNPKLIIVDEPTAGLDPAERIRFLNVLRSLSTDNIVIFSTHLVEDIRELCNDMAIINKGTLLNQKKPIQAINELKGKIWETSFSIKQLSDKNISFTALSEKYNEDNILINRIYSNENNSNFIKVKPKLEDYYFMTLNRSLNV